MKMKNRMTSMWLAFAMSPLTLATLQAGTFNANFNDGQVPASCQVFGHTVVETTGGVGDTGALKITKAINSQSGSFIIEDLDAGATVYGFRASFMARVGGGTATPADGWSFNFAPDIVDGAFSETGSGTGITVMIDTYDNVDSNPNNTTGEAPQISIKVGNQIIATSGILPLSDLITGNQFVSVNINVNADGSLDMDYNGKVFFSKLFLPGYQPLVGARFGIGGRTGGANENCFIDDLSIETLLTPLPGIVRNLQDFTQVEGTSPTLSLQVNNGDGATIQWFRDGTVIPGETGLNYTFGPVTAADNGAKFSATVTLGANVVTSAVATLKVVAIDLPASPELSFDFNDGFVPAGTTVGGTALVNYLGGVDNSGVLVLTDAFNDQNGWFLIDDPHAGAPVYGIAARFDLRMGGGSEVPADGFSFNFAADIPEVNSEFENGVGTGLSVTFDTYDNTDGNPNNGTGEAPSVGVKFGGATVSERLVPLSALQTGDGYADVIIRLTQDGLIDVVWNGSVIFERQAVPGFNSISGGRIGLGARTGGSYDVHAIDNLKIYTFLTADVVRIVTQPQPQTVLLGRPVTFSVGVNLADTTTYQWYKNGTPINGATEDSFTLAATTAADQGTKYKVVVKRGIQTVTSDEATLSIVDLAAPRNPQVHYDFNSGLPAGTQIGGTGIIEAFGGVNDSGVLKLTIAENSQNGGFLSELVAAGGQMLEFTLAVDILAGGGTAAPADGFSINIGSDMATLAPGDAEKGGGTGLTIGVDTYDNVDNNPNNDAGEAPAINIIYKSKTVQSKRVPLSLVNVADTFFTVLLRVRQDGTLDLVYGDSVIFNGCKIPGFVPINGAKVALYARTGGANANYWFDNLSLEALLPTAVTIASEPSDALVLEGQPATFSVQASNPQGVTYQWSRNGILIPGANQPVYTTGPQALTDEGAGYSVLLTGPGNSVNSRTARVQVLAAFSTAANPVVNFNFDDGAVPSGSAVWGNAYVEEGIMKLTLAENSQSSSFIIDSPIGANPLTDFVATWNMRVGGGSGRPADGFSFSVAPDLPDADFGEDGAGSGLSVSFDIYDNGGGEAPAIDIFFKGELVATRKFDFSVLETGEAFVPVGVRMNRTGTLDLYYDTTAVYRELSLPGYGPMAASRIGWGARTGGENENQWIDDVKLSINTQPMPVERPQFTSIVKNSDGTITVTWTGGGTLQAATTVLGPWQDVAGATSPHTFSLTSPAMFGRVRR